MTIIRHEGLSTHRSHLSEDAIRRELLKLLAVAWLLYFMLLAILTAVYIAIRGRLSEQALKSLEECANGQRRSSKMSNDSLVSRFSKKTPQKHIPKASRLSIIPLGEDGEEQPDFKQSGFQSWLLGRCLRLLWLMVPCVSQAQLAWLTWEQYFGLGWELSANKFLFVYAVSHLTLFALAKYFNGPAKAFFLKPCSLEEASEVGVLRKQPESGRYDTMDLVRVHRYETDGSGAQGGRYYEYTCIRYIWDDTSYRFRPAGAVGASGATAHEDLASGGHKQEVAERLLCEQGQNLIFVEVPGIARSLIEEFFQESYIFQMLCIWCYVYWDAWNVALLWTILVVSSGVWKSQILRRNRQQISELAQEGNEKTQSALRGGQWVDVKATELTPGDIVQVFDGSVAADIVLLMGSAVVNESMLTGEPMPLQKVSLEPHMQFMFSQTQHGKKHALYAGTEVLQSVPDEDANASQGAKCAVGMVLSTAGRTSKGQLIRMVLFPSEVRFKYTEQLPFVYAMMTCWAIGCCSCAVILQSQSFVHGCFKGLAFLTQALNPMMAVSFTLGQSCSASRLKEENIACLNFARIPIAGSISTMVFDKTGTITQGGMDLTAVRPISNGSFQDEVSAAELNDGLAANEVLLQALAGCHSVSTMRDGRLVGNQVEVVTVTALGWKLAASGEPRSVRDPSGREELTVLRQLEFDHHSMTSGAVVRSKATGRILVFIKGAYDKISLIAAASSIPKDYSNACEEYATKCFYVLAMSWKELPSDSSEASIANTPRESLEQNLQLCGLMLFRNEMKPDSSAAIADLKCGGIKCVMCTGDNTTTGISIGRQCGIISDGARVLLGDIPQGGEQDMEWRDPDGHYPSLALADWRTVKGHVEIALSQAAFRHLVQEEHQMLNDMLPLIKVYGRMKPDDKIKVISLWQAFGDEGTVTGMTGDGGNDCGALRKAHAGIALSDAEASMVSPFSTSRGCQELGYISLSAVVELVKEGRACLATNMSTFVYFMVYNFMITSTKILLIAWMDTTYSEWAFIAMDCALAMFMVSLMVRCGPAEKLAPSSPCASLFGTTTIVTVISLLAIYWLTWGSAMLLLQYGPGEAFYEPSTTQLSEIPPQEWTRQSDNYVAATAFIVAFSSLVTAGFILCYGHVHRQAVFKNFRMCGFYIIGITFVLALTWSHPNDFSCVFRVNCDSKISKSMNVPLLSRPIRGIIFSCGNLGGCFLGPQVVSCKSESGSCWVIPPNNANVSASWTSPPNATRPKAPFDTVADKVKFCEQHPYKSGDEYDLGNQWCFNPSLHNENSSTCGPTPEKDLGPMVEGCEGPNNCYNSDFKRVFTVLLFVSGAAMHVTYKFGVLGVGDS